MVPTIPPVRADELLAGGLGAATDDPQTVQGIVHLRSALGSYLLAVSALEEGGVAVDVIATVLQRGVDEADAMLGRMVGPVEVLSDR